MAEATETSAKYQKLAAEYSKLRAQASVLKKAVLEEQTKSSSLRENLRVKEATLRKTEQEVDSLGFRNKQLERTVAKLQEDLELEFKRASAKGGAKSKSSTGAGAADPSGVDAQLLTEELQKKILENAQLVTQLDDRGAEVGQCQLRLDGLNRELQHQASLEQKLRKEMEALALRNTELEAKISEAASTIGSEDGLSVTADMENHYNNHFSSNSSQAGAVGGSSNNNNNHNNNNNNGTSSGTNNNCDDRIVFLEKELSHWRAQYELLKVESASYREVGVAASASSVVRGEEVSQESEKNSEDNQTQSEFESREEKLTQRFTKSIGDLFHDKCRAESKLASHLLESQRLQSHLDIMKNRLKECEDAKRDEEHRYRIIEDELARTRLNYEEQISVLTEQVISLSDQLANCK